MDRYISSLLCVPHERSADDLDNTLILMQYVKNLGVDEDQIRDNLGISKLAPPSSQT
jgi:hypothetical protein